MTTRPIPAPQRDVYTVSRLNKEARRLLETGLPMLLVEGEISNLAMPASGHWYFSLKDANAQIRCAMFRGRNNRLRIRPQNGMQVVVRGRVSLYEPRGDYQLIAEHMSEAGEGALQRAFEALKIALDKEGLFDIGRKKPLPALPTRVGVITSPSGAVIRDICRVLARRFPALAIRVYPVPVQGEAAVPAIVAALALAARRADCDVLILARGGGSLEDLWAFNDESVARAVAACPLPTISAIGHETDVTICDFVADVRAATPSAAAEMVAPDAAELNRALTASGQRLARALRATLSGANAAIKVLNDRHDRSHPGVRVNQLAQRLDHLDRRLHAALQQRLAATSLALAGTARRLATNSPRQRLALLRARYQAALTRLDTTLTRTLTDQRARLAVASRALHSVGPQATLERGYAIVTRADKSVALDAHALHDDERVHIRLAKGSTDARVVRRRT